MSNLKYCSCSSWILIMFILVMMIPHLACSEGPKRVLSVIDYGAGDGQHDDTKAFQEAWKIACSSRLGVKQIFFPYGKTYLLYPLDLVGPCQSNVTLLACEVAPAVREGCFSFTDAISFHRCNHLKVKDLKLLDSQQIHVAITNCMNVITSNLRVLAPAFSPNTDGIHIGASKGVEVKDYLIQTGDDCISIVSNSSKIRITNLTCVPAHGISIGSLGKFNSWEKVQDVTVDGAFLYRTDNGVRIKTWQSSAVKVKHISFINIRETSASEKAIKFACSDASPCEDLHLENIFLTPCCGGLVRSFCWEAHGFIRGPVMPSACSPVFQNFIAPEEYCEIANPQAETNEQVKEQPAAWIKLPELDSTRR